MTGIAKNYYELLKTWCEKLIDLQINEFEEHYFKGGILCPSCKIIHGRVADAIYPMIFLYDRTGDKKYLDTAELLFDWSENMMADDGSYYNDAQNDWNGITVFFVSMLSRTLLHHENCLPDSLRKRFEARLKRNVQWICSAINNSFDANINYQSAAAEAIALYGSYVGDPEYLRYAGERAGFCMRYISGDGFLTGESHPRDYRSPRGVGGVDIGYNLEESLPALFECAEILGDRDMKKRLLFSLEVHCRFLLPDGGMDNSFGSRNYKWTYWGSRTSDGYLSMMEQAGQEKEEFLSYKYAAFQMFSQCTKDGLLYGGPDYHDHGEQPCIHHTFCKAKAVAAFLDGGVTETKRRSRLPEEIRIYRYPELLTEQYFCGGFYGTATVNDVLYQKGGHISGGTMGMLWHEKTGPLLAASVTRYSLYEVTNSQLSLKKKDLGKMALRFEENVDKNLFASDQDFAAELKSTREPEMIRAEVKGTLRTLEQEPGGPYRFLYEISRNRFAARCFSDAKGRLYVPVIGRSIDRQGENTFLLTARTGERVRITAEGIFASVKKRFHLCGGFIAWELEISPVQGQTGVVLEVLKE